MENKIPVKRQSVSTYAEDMAKVIEGDQAGLIKKIIHDEEEKEFQKRNSSPETRKNKFYLYLGIFLILLALGTLGFFVLRKSDNAIPVVEPAKELIFNDKSFYLEISGLNKDQIFSSVLNELNSSTLKIGGVEGIYLTENKVIVGLRRFIELTKSNFVPGSNALISDNFLMGMANNQKRDFFLLLKTSSSMDIFKPLQLWETEMFSDLHAFFGQSITAENKYLLTEAFEDAIIENKNARVLYTKDGDISLMYVYIDENSVVIANTNTAVREIMLRLLSSQIKK